MSALKKKKQYYLLFSLIVIFIVLLSSKFDPPASFEPQVIYTADVQYNSFEQFQRNWEDAILLSATVIGETKQRLILELEYMYSGSHGEIATTCGTVFLQNDRLDLGCRPNGIKKGHHKVRVQYSTYQQTPQRGCSDAIAFNIYDQKGSTFFSEKFIYAKTWQKSAGGILNYFADLFHTC